MLKRLKMARLRRKASLPIPAFRVHLGSGPHPDYEGQTYYDSTLNVLYWVGPLSSRDDERDFLHECGHAFDFAYLSNDDRARAMMMLTSKARSWFWDRSPFESSRELDPVCEVFADAFAEMCRSPRRRPALRALVLGACPKR